MSPAALVKSCAIGAAARPGRRCAVPGWRVVVAAVPSTATARAAAGIRPS